MWRLPRAARYTLRVDSSAAHASRRTRDLVLAMTPAARIELALSLGEDDLRLFMKTSGLDRESALNQLRRQRHQGRTPSVASAGGGSTCASSS